MKGLKQLTLLKMCATFPLCGLGADLWPFYGFYYQGCALQRNSPTDSPKEHGRKFAPTVPIASKFPLGNTR